MSVFDAPTPAGGLLPLVPDISGEDDPPCPVPVTAGQTCCGCATHAQRLWQGPHALPVCTLCWLTGHLDSPTALPVCTLCWLTGHLDSPTALHGHLALLPDAPAADLINLQRRALIALRSGDRATRRDGRRMWNWLSRHAREVVNMWGTARASEFARAMQRLSPARRKAMQHHLEGCVLILPPDVFDDLTLLLPEGRTAENSFTVPVPLKMCGDTVLSGAG